ncbi:telomere length regulation protein-domain-containing protein [Gongronella butleri]|nr:telomere length regulation protein-domain-containing protein [Gongronella butleri]
MGLSPADLIALDASVSAASGSASADDVRGCVRRPLAGLDAGLVANAAWTRHVQLIFGTLVPQWGMLLTTTAEDRHALQATLVGASNGKEWQHSGELRVQLAQVSLPVLLACLPLATEAGASLDVLDTYATLLRHYVSADQMALYVENAHFIDDHALFASHLCSLPAKLANTFGLRHTDFQDDDTREWYTDTRFYPTITRHIAAQMSQTCNDTALELITELLAKMVRQGYQDVCFSAFLTVVVDECARQADAATYQRRCLQIWKRLDRLTAKETRHGAVLRYIQQQLTRFHPPLASTALASAIQRLATRLQPILYDASTVADFVLYALTIKLGHWPIPVVRTAVAMGIHAIGLAKDDNIDGDDATMPLADETKLFVYKCADKVTERWADPVFINHSSDSERQYLTACLMILFGYTDELMMGDIQSTGQLRNGITAWLKTADAATAKLSMIVAEVMADKMSNGRDKLDFGVDMEQDLLDLKALAYAPDALVLVDLDQPLTVVEEPDDAVASNLDSDGDEEDEDELDPDALVVPDDDDDEDEKEDPDLVPYAMEDESDEEEVDASKKKRVRTPAYLSELSDYLKNQEDPVMLEVALRAAAPLIRVKIGHGTEIDEWAPTLVQRLIMFPESYSITDQQQLQIQALAALVVGSPQIAAPLAIDQVFSKNTSVSQRTMILRVLSIAALELSGWDTSKTSSSAPPPAGTALPPIPLPVEDHQEAMQLDWPAPPSTSSSSKVVFKSSRMAAEQRQQQKIQRNQLAGIAGRCFFFPLVTGWWDATQTRLGWLLEYPMLVEQLIMTLNVVMQCASNTTDKRKIVQEYFDFALSMRFIPNLSPRAVRALLLGFHTILQVCYKDQGNLLLMDYTAVLVDTKQWLEGRKKKLKT